MKQVIHYPSPTAHDLLWKTETKIGEKSFIALPIEVKGNELVFELTDKQAIPQVNFIKKWFLALRAISLTSMFIPTICTFVFLKQQNIPFNLYAAIVSIIIPCLLLLSVNVMNDVKDHLKLIDMPGSLGGSGVIQKGWITPRQLSYFSYSLILISLSLSIPLFISQTILLLPLALATLAIVIGYSGGPFNFKYNGLGDLVVFLACGPLLTASYAFTTFNQIPTSVLWLGAIFGFLACGILHANNMNDIKADTARGAKTLASVLGFEASKKMMMFYYAGAFLGLVFLVVQGNLKPLQILPCALALIPTFKFLRLINKAKNPDEPSISSIRFISPQIHLLTGILLCLGIGFLKGS